MESVLCPHRLPSTSRPSRIRICLAFQRERSCPWHIAESPNLITLDTLAGEAAHHLVLIFSGFESGLDLQLHHGFLVGSSHASRCTNGIALDKCRCDLRLAFPAELVHGYSICVTAHACQENNAG